MLFFFLILLWRSVDHLLCAMMRRTRGRASRRPLGSLFFHSSRGLRVARREKRSSLLPKLKPPSHLRVVVERLKHGTKWSCRRRVVFRAEAFCWDFFLVRSEFNLAVEIPELTQRGELSELSLLSPRTSPKETHA